MSMKYIIEVSAWRSRVLIKQLWVSKHYKLVHSQNVRYFTT